MTALQLNAEIYRTMGVIAEDEDLLQKALNYLKKLASQKTEEVLMPADCKTYLGNRVYIDDGKVKTDIVAETMSIEEAKRLTLQVIDLEYSLP